MSIIINIKNKFLFSAKSDGATPNVESKRLEEEEIQEVATVSKTVKKLETVPTRTVATETGPVATDTGLVATEMEPARTMVETSSNVKKV